MKKKQGWKNNYPQKIHPFTSSGPNPRMRMNLMKMTSFRVSRLDGWWLICLDLRWKVRPAWGVLGNGSNWSNLCFTKMTPCCSQIYTRLSEFQTSSFPSPGWWLDWFAWTFSKSCWLLSWSPGTFKYRGNQWTSLVLACELRHPNNWSALNPLMLSNVPNLVTTLKQQEQKRTQLILHQPWQPFSCPSSFSCLSFSSPPNVQSTLPDSKHLMQYWVHLGSFQLWLS